MRRSNYQVKTQCSSYYRGWWTINESHIHVYTLEGDSALVFSCFDVLSSLPVGTSVNSTDGAQLDVAVNGFWGGRHEKTFLDVRISNPYADSNRTTSQASTYTVPEARKWKKKDVRGVGTWGGACLFYTVSDVCYRRNGKCSISIWPLSW